MYKCQYCGKQYKSEKWLEKHNCDKKLKNDNRDNPIVILAHDLWKNSLSIKYNKIENFEKSSLYKLYIKVALFCLEKDCPDSHNYVNFLIEHKIKEKDWNSDNTYQKFIERYTKKENPRDAICRTIKFIEKNGYFGKFMKDCPIGKILTYIDTGRISPWLFIITNDDNFFRRMNKEQKQYYNKLLGSSWNIKMNKYDNTIKKLIKELKDIEI